MNFDGKNDDNLLFLKLYISCVLVSQAVAASPTVVVIITPPIPGTPNGYRGVNPLGYRWTCVICHFESRAYFDSGVGKLWHVVIWGVDDFDMLWHAQLAIEWEWSNYTSYGRPRATCRKLKELVPPCQWGFLDFIRVAFSSSLSSTASSRSQWALPDLNRERQISVPMSERMSK